MGFKLTGILNLFLGIFQTFTLGLGFMYIASKTATGQTDVGLNLGSSAYFYPTILLFTGLINMSLGIINLGKFNPKWKNGLFIFNVSFIIISAFLTQSLSNNFIVQVIKPSF